MPEASPASIDHFPAFLARLPPGLDLEALGRETKAFRRARGVRSATDLLRLALAWGPGGYSLQRVAAWAGVQGIAEMTDEALTQRLHGMVPFLAAVTSHLLIPVTPAPCWLGRVLRISDSTSLSKQASKGTDWRIHGVYDLARGGFSHLELTDCHGGEALDRGRPVAGEIRIADRGYANAPAWQRFCQAGAVQADYIVRMRWNTVRLVDAANQPVDLTGLLQALPPETETHELAVRVQSGRRQTPVPIRLVVRRRTPEAIAAAYKHLRQQASRIPRRTASPRRPQTPCVCNQRSFTWSVLNTATAARPASLYHQSLRTRVKFVGGVAATVTFDEPCITLRVTNGASAQMAGGFVADCDVTYLLDHVGLARLAGNVISCATAFQIR